MRREFEIYTDLLLKWNQRIGFTKYSTKEIIHEKLIQPSRLFSSLIPENSSVIDIGTGPGVPGLIIAIEKPESEFVLLDSKEASIEFVETCAREIGLKNISVFCGRAEKSAHEVIYREKFDYLVARSFAPLPVTLEIGCGYVENGGKILVHSPPRSETFAIPDESIADLGLKLDRIHSNEKSIISVTSFIKFKPTSEKYPRSWSAIKNKPIF